MEAQPVMSPFMPHGMIIPLVTPFKTDEMLDLEALRRLVNRLINAGVHGLFPAGSTGEFFALNYNESQQIIETVIEETNGRVPVYAGAGAISTRGAINAARSAEAMGADAVVIITPFYLSPSQEELYQHYAAIAASTSLPVIPYNNPVRTGGVNIAPSTLARLAQIDNLVAIKDSSGNMAQMLAYVSETPDHFCVLQGLDSIFFPALVGGAVGGVAGSGNLIPEVVVELYNAFQDGDWEQARTAQSKVTLVREIMTTGTFPSGLKLAMDMIGQSTGPARRPAGTLDQKQAERVRDLLSRAGLAVNA
jgi:4-hydroxy-tetrahydrodipicolinate synthase